MYMCVMYRSGESESVIGPLTTDTDVPSTQQEEEAGSDDNATQHSVEPEQHSGPFVYRFQLWARSVGLYCLLLVECFISGSSLCRRSCMSGTICDCDGQLK